MSATISKFPKAMKRGPKVKKGPAADVAALPIEPPKDKPFRMSDRIISMLVEKMRAADSKERDDFLRRQEIGTCTPEYYAEGTICCASTDNKGSGPNFYVWGKHSVRDSEILRFNDRETALKLAIDTLNSIAHLIRFGGLKVSSTYALKGFDEEALRLYEDSCIATLAETMVKLRAFGAQA